MLAAAFLSHLAREVLSEPLKVRFSDALTAARSVIEEDDVLVRQVPTRRYTDDVLNQGCQTHLAPGRCGAPLNGRAPR